MRMCGLILALLLAACGQNEAGGDNAQAPAPQPSGPPPLTPTMNVTGPPGDAAPWMDPTSNAGDPATAPYGNLLDQPVVNVR